MKVVNKLFLVVRILGVAVFVLLAAGATYFIISAYQQEGNNNTPSFCSQWDKSAVDKYFQNHGIDKFDSQINCNTYYLELQDIPLATLETAANNYNLAIDVEFILVNGDEVFFGQIIDQELVVTVSSVL